MAKYGVREYLKWHDIFRPEDEVTLNWYREIEPETHLIWEVTSDTHRRRRQSEIVDVGPGTSLAT